MRVTLKVGLAHPILQQTTFMYWVAAMVHDKEPDAIRTAP